MPPANALVLEAVLPSRSDGKPSISKVYYEVTGVAVDYDRITAAGATVAVPFGDHTYGRRDFRAVGPDGNQLSCGERLVK
jgi:hypothetical protein